MPLPFDPFPKIERGTPGAFAATWHPIQRQIAERATVAPLDPLPRFVAGADCAFTADKRSIHAVVLVWDRIERKVVDLASEFREVSVPYVSGYLSFREGPAILAAIAKLKRAFGVITFDGQGIAHPRRAGLATHLGVALDVPSVGVAKSRLIGVYDEPARPAGSRSRLLDRGDEIGTVLRTRDDIRPLFVSVGHKVDLDSAAALVMACVTKYRVPEPTRVADIEVAKVKKSLAPSPSGTGPG
jgi:deoxyribonuclease V